MECKVKSKREKKMKEGGKRKNKIEYSLLLLPEESWNYIFYNIMILTFFLDTDYRNTILNCPQKGWTLFKTNNSGQK